MSGRDNDRTVLLPDLNALDFDGIEGTLVIEQHAELISHEN